MAKQRYLFTSESVTEGHPDKLADQISDSVLDAILEKDPLARVACETSLNTGLALVTGEITTLARPEIARIVRNTIREVGYDHPDYGFDGKTVAVLVSVDEQSPDIAQGVNQALETRSRDDHDGYLDSVGAGDQGMVFGFATDETPEYLPTSIALAHGLSRRLAEVRKSGEIPYLRPDGKSQVTVEYEGDRPVRVDTIVISAQHNPDVELETIRKDVIAKVIKIRMSRQVSKKGTESASELTRADIIAKYPHIPALIILKTDVQRRGVFYTDQALSVLDEEQHSVTGTHIFGSRDGRIASRPESLLLRDGTSIITTPTPLEQHPYVVDLHDGKPYLFDEGVPLEEVDYWPAPAFYSLTSRSGIPMKNIVSCRPQRLNIFPYRYCTFWNNNKGCAFCDIVCQLKKGKEELQIPAKLDPVEVAEVVGEALKEPGRFSAVFLTSGSITTGRTPFDEEVDYYIAILKEVGKHFRTKKYPSQLIGTAFTEKQLERLYSETGLLSYTADIEVLNEKLFNRLCPGKAEWVGYAEWKRRLVRAVDIFGRGRVNTGLVAGIELAKPYGFASEEKALARTLEEAEELASQGVSTVFIVWSPRPGTLLADQQNASLEYYVRLAEGLHNLRVKYRLPIAFDDYRHCGNHPDTDLSRLLPF